MINNTSEVVAAVSVDTESAECICVPSFPCFPTCNNTLSISEEINVLTSTTTTPSSLPSSSATAIQKTPHCVSLKKSSLRKRGYKTFEDWNSDPNHVYIGRNMSHCVAGALGSKWGNPFKAKKANKKSLNKCLERYEDHIRRNPDLFNAVMELEGKELGCWCKPSPCHGDILIKLFKERQGVNPCSSRSDNQELTPVLRLRGGEGEDTSHVAPGNNSQYVSNENDPLSFVNQDDSMSEQDIRDILFEAGYTIEDINDIIASKSKSNESAGQTSMEQSEISESESGIDGAHDMLREIRVKNVNKVVIEHSTLTH